MRLLQEIFLDPNTFTCRNGVIYVDDHKGIPLLAVSDTPFGRLGATKVADWIMEAMKEKFEREQTKAPEYHQV